MADLVIPDFAQMEEEELLLLYALVLGLKPKRALEIGVFEGGSSAIILAAMERNGEGRLVSVDPHPHIDAPAIPAQERWHLISTTFAEAHTHIEPGIDFAFVDGDHSYAGVVFDIEGVLPLLANDAYVLFHDAYNPDVSKAIDDALKSHPDLLDCGMLSRTPKHLEHMGAVYCGLRLLRWY